VLNSAWRHLDVRNSGCKTPLILTLSTRWRWVVSLTLLSLYPGGKHPRYPVDRRLGDSHSQTGRCERNISCPLGKKFGGLIIIPTELPWLFELIKLRIQHPSRISRQDLCVLFTGVVTIVKFPVTHQDRTTTYQYYTELYEKQIYPRN
jgi:hypothetical protein